MSFVRRQQPKVSEIQTELLFDARDLFEKTLTKDVADSHGLDLIGKRVGDIVINYSCLVVGDDRLLPGGFQYEACTLLPLTALGREISGDKLPDFDIEKAAQHGWLSKRLGQTTLGNQPIQNVVPGYPYVALDYLADTSANVSSETKHRSRRPLESAQAFILSAMDFVAEAGQGKTVFSEEDWVTTWQRNYTFNRANDLPLNGFEDSQFLDDYYQEKEDHYVKVDDMLHKFKLLGKPPEVITALEEELLETQAAISRVLEARRLKGVDS